MFSSCGTGSRSTASARASNPLTADCNCASTYSAKPYVNALWREAMVCSLVPSKATVPSFNRFFVPTTFSAEANFLVQQYLRDLLTVTTHTNFT